MSSNSKDKMDKFEQFLDTYYRALLELDNGARIHRDGILQRARESGENAPPLPEMITYPKKPTLRQEAVPKNIGPANIDPGSVNPNNKDDGPDKPKF